MEKSSAHYDRQSVCLLEWTASLKTTLPNLLTVCPLQVPANYSIVQVFELGGDVVAPSLAHGLMRLIAEGAGEGDESADAELRAQAAAAYMQLLSKPKLPNILIKVF